MATKKFLTLIVAFMIICCTSVVFANGEIQDSAAKTSNTVKNAPNNIGNAVKDTGTAIGTGVRDVGNTMENVTHMGDTSTDNYTATRTATGDGTFLGMSGNTWTWFILAIAALAIIGLVWYYAMQNKNEYDHH